MNKLLTILRFQALPYLYLIDKESFYEEIKKPYKKDGYTLMEWYSEELDSKILITLFEEEQIFYLTVFITCPKQLGNRGTIEAVVDDMLPIFDKSISRYTSPDHFVRDNFEVQTANKYYCFSVNYEIEKNG